MKVDLERRGADVLVIGGGAQAAARMATRLLKAPYPILHDPERSVYRAYGFDRALGVIQQTGTVLIDRDGTILHTDRGLNPFDALDPARLLKALDTPGS